MTDLRQSGAGLVGYALLAAQAETLFADERDLIVNATRFFASLFHELSDLNWAGFHLSRNGKLALGSFQGKVAHVRIPFSKDVCGAAARIWLVQRVDDVHAFPGHIACDSASSSKLVVSLPKDGRLVAVLDLDGLSVGCFSTEDQAGIEGLTEIFLCLTDRRVACSGFHCELVESPSFLRQQRLYRRAFEHPREMCNEGRPALLIQVFTGVT